jgi:hypothetical protein
VLDRLGQQVGRHDSLYDPVADLPGDGFAGPDGLLEQHGPPTLVGRGKAAADAEVARHLWDVSEQLTGVALHCEASRASGRSVTKPRRESRGSPQRSDPEHDVVTARLPACDPTKWFALRFGR